MSWSTRGIASPGGDGSILWTLARSRAALDDKSLVVEQLEYGIGLVGYFQPMTFLYSEDR